MRFKVQWFTSIASILLLASTTGCSIKQITARRIVAAPNRFPSSLNKKLEKDWDWTRFEKKFSPNEIGQTFVRTTIPVGPPNAKLNAVILPPRDYNVKILSKFSQSANGKTLSIEASSVQERSFQALQNPATIFILHGYSMTKESMALWALELAQAGYRVVLVDLRGHGKSTGWEISFGKYETQDLSRVLDYLIEKNLCDERVGVLGLSYGGTLALHWAANDSRVRTAVAIAPYNRADEAMKAFAKEIKIPISQKTMESAVALVGEKYDVDWAKWSGESAARQLKQPALFISGELDGICHPAEIEKLRQAAPPGSKVIQVPDANHLAIGYYFHELTEPVKTWFGERLETDAVTESAQISGN